LKPDNAGGAKGPDFWCAFEDSEVVVIGDEPENTIKRQALSETAVSRGEGETLTAQMPACGRLLSVCLSVKPVGKPDAGNRHVRLCVQ
jgi:hypothetical protein